MSSAISSILMPKIDFLAVANPPTVRSLPMLLTVSPIQPKRKSLKHLVNADLREWLDRGVDEHRAVCLPGDCSSLQFHQA